ncbi:MAG: type II toxin-antitoxin system VapC family toxin [Deltaproteobacteria bacterium]|nr:type II toxin-antitoxin system VapC family toxin [Deltaproteobacteria bacterium]
MKRFVVDASVAVKWFVPEIHSDAAARLLDGPHELLAPDLIVAEFGNILWKKIQRKEITRDEGREIAKVFRSIPFTFVPSSDLLEAAMEIAHGIGRSVYDCLYLTLAVARRCRLVTADRRFFTAVGSTPFADNIRWLEEFPPK